MEQTYCKQRKTEKLKLINKHKDEIKHIISYIAASIWTDNKPIEYQLYITCDGDIFVMASDQAYHSSYLTVTTDAWGDSQITPYMPRITKRKYTILSYDKNKQWLKTIIDNTLTDKEIYEIIDNYNHNIRLIIEGYSNLFAIPVFDALELLDSMHENNNARTMQNKTMAEIVPNITTEIISKFADKFEKNNFDEIWQKITE